MKGKRRFDMKTRLKILVPRLAVLLLALIPAASGAAEAGNTGLSIDGTWRWTFTMPDGTTSRPKLVLATVNGKLTGTNSFRAGTARAITNAVLRGNELRFQVIRHRIGQEIVTTYTGKWIGRTIKGKVESNWAGENQVYDWEAERAHLGAEGTWKYPVTIRGRKVDAEITLEQEGETLTGSMPGFGRARRRIEIKNGSIKNGEVYFETEWGTGEDVVVTIYKGKQTGDKIKGAIETSISGEPQKFDWEARRVD